MSRNRRPPVVAWVVALALALGVGLAVGGGGGFGAGAPAAREHASPAPPAVATAVLVEVAVSGLPAGEASIGAATVRLPPGTASRPFAGTGPTVVRVQEGTLTVEELGAGDAATERNPPAGAASPRRRSVPAGEFALIPAEVTTVLRNDGDRTATLVVVAIEER